MVERPDGDPVERPPFDPAAIRAVAFDGYGTLFRYHDDEFRVAVTEVLTAQKLEHPDHDAVYRSFVGAWARAGPWSDRFPRDATRAPSDGGDAEPDPAREAARREAMQAARRHMLGGPLPPWFSTREIWRRQWEITFGEHGLAGDAELAANHLRDELTVAGAYPDAHDTTERLAAHGLLLGLLSNADEDFLQGAVSRNRLRFSVIQSSESLRAYKPNRVTFLALCHRLGYEPEQVLYVGDSAPTDVQGASHAGLRTVWVRRSEREYPEGVAPPDLEVTALSEIADRLGAP